MSDPSHYSHSDWYRPGLMNEVGALAAAIALVLALFVASIIGSRYLLLTSRKLSPRTKRVLRFLSSLGNPADKLSFGRRQRGRSSSRRRTEPHQLTKVAVAPPGRSDAALAADLPEMVETRPRGRLALDLSPLPEEAWPFYDADEVGAVVEVLRSGKVNQWTGTKVFAFEQAYARLLRNGRAIALANGSVALELILRALKIGPGDEVIVTPRSFVASAFCVRLVGATPVFVDVDRNSGNITAATIAGALSDRTRAIIPVHLGGWPADMPAIMALAKARGIHVIEDCAQAHGAEIDGLPVGSFGDAAAFSFCQDKIITTGGEGGLVAIRDDEAYEAAWSFKDHGKDRRRAFERPAEPGFRWLHDSVGTNWRMTEIAAAIGLIQLDKLAAWRFRRAANAEIWAEALRPIAGLRVPQPPDNVTGAYYKFYVYVDVDPADNRRLRDLIMKEATAKGLRIFSGSCSEMYREAAFADMKVETLPIAHALGEASLMFEVHPTLETRRLRDRADAVAEIVGKLLR